MAKRRVYGVPDLLPPPINGDEKPSGPTKYVTIPTDLHAKLKEEAAERGYGFRAFVIEILRRAMEGR